MKSRLLLALSLPLVLAAPARADGAFPGGMAVLLPRDHPERLHVAATFGLLTSEDGGAHWYSICERASVPQGGNVSLYMLGAGDALFALSMQGLSSSTDGGRTWVSASGTIKDLIVLDAFPDPNDASYVLVLAAGTNGSSGLYPSNDGGHTFGEPILVTDAEQLRSVEFSREPSGVLYVTTLQLVDATSSKNFLLRSTDRGVHWERHDISALPNGLARIAQVDPTDGGTLYLRVTNIDNGRDSLGIVTEGGKQVSLPLSLDGAMGGFARGDDGTLYVGELAGGLWRRAPGETDWSRRETAAIQCLGARGETLYACGTGAGGAFALGEAINHGESFTSIFTFNEVIGPLPCDPVLGACAAEWETLRSTYDFIGHAPPSDGSFACEEAPDEADAGTTSPPSAKPPESCGCRGSTAGLPGFVLVAILRRRTTQR